MNSTITKKQVCYDNPTQTAPETIAHALSRNSRYIEKARRNWGGTQDEFDRWATRQTADRMRQVADSLTVN